jgi:hypothetical protein
MTTPFPLRRGLPSSSHDANAAHTTAASQEWRCTCCGKLLGVCRDGRMHLRFARSHEYLVGFPVVATCRGCGTLNRVTVPATR